MFKKLLSRKSKKAPDAVSTLTKLRENLETLEKKERLLQKKVSAEVEKATNFTKLKNKKAAIQCLKKKKLYEAQIEQLGNLQLRVHDQVITLEGARATTDTIDALRAGASAVKKIQKSLNVDDIDKTTEEINDSVMSMKQIQEVLSAPLAGADFDEDELEAELEELEELEAEELLNLPQRNSVPTTAQGERIPTREKHESNSEVQELTRLQAEMAI